MDKTWGFQESSIRSERSQEKAVRSRCWTIGLRSDRFCQARSFGRGRFLLVYHFSSLVILLAAMAKALDFLSGSFDAPGPSKRRLDTATSSAKNSRGPQASQLDAFSSRSRQNAAKANLEDDDDDDEAEVIAAALQKHNVKAGAQVAKAAAKIKGKAKSGETIGGSSFQSMGLLPALLRSLLLRGYTTPTPIQRASIPSIVSLPQRDLVGMARTGSGKTLAYIVPLIHKLNGRHATSFGIKSIILCPGRELALQILKVGKDISRGCKPDDAEAIRWAMIVGGESMDEQFALMASNPDVVIGTPGRLLHLAVEMNLDLSAVQYTVFDEADRLFEMGFAAQLEELLKRLPPSRQTLLFSATLPKSLVEFARAGLGPNPRLVRLDAESKISADLGMGFFSVKPGDKEAALLILLRDVIGVPFGQGVARGDGGWGDKKRKRLSSKPSSSGMPGGIRGTDRLLPHQTIIFCATKHHVEYLLALLTNAGYACSHIYSSLDQAARSLEMKKFREGETSLLVVTDVAARGIDLPVLEHVVNYDFTPSARVFVHRVGRTARAGKSGWAWSLIVNKDLPALCDLALFLNRPLQPPMIVDDAEPLDAHTSLHLGALPRESLDVENEYLTTTLPSINSNTADQLIALKQVVVRAQKMYERSNGGNKPGPQIFKQAKKMMDVIDEGGEGDVWKLAGSGKEDGGISDFYRRPSVYGLAGPGPDASTTTERLFTKTNAATEEARAGLLAKISNFRPAETVFEVGTRGEATPLTKLMKDRRKTLAVNLERRKLAKVDDEGIEEDEGSPAKEMNATSGDSPQAEQADEDDIEAVFDVGGSASVEDTEESNDRSASKKQSGVKKDYKDPDFYMGYQQKDAHTEKGYALSSGADFVSQARMAAFGLNSDDGTRFGTTSQAPSASRWDTKKKKFVKGDGVGADNQKMIRTEAGTKLPATFRSGRFDEWKKKNKVDFAKVGEREEDNKSMKRFSSFKPGGSSASAGGGDGYKKYRHNKTEDAKRLDPLSKDYDKKLKARKAKAGEGSRIGRDGRDSSSKPPPGGKGGPKRGGPSGARKSGAYAGQKARNELKSSHQIAKERIQKEKRREKTARAPKGRGKKGGGKGRR